MPGAFCQLDQTMNEVLGVPCNELAEHAWLRFQG